MTGVCAESFPRQLRLRRRAEFRAVQGRGRKGHTPHFLLFALDGEPGETRFGITASRKVGSAVVRNRLKRYLRETFRVVYDERRISARELSERLSLGLTSGSTRLINLYKQRLVGRRENRVAQGREYIYHSLSGGFGLA